MVSHNRKKGQKKLSTSAKSQPTGEKRYWWVPNLLKFMGIVVAITLGIIGYCSTQDQIRIQEQELREYREEQARRNEQWNAEFQELKKSTLATTYHSVLEDLASDQPERRLAGLRSAEALVESPQYRDSIRVAVIEALGRHMHEYAETTSLQIKQVEPFIAQAGTALKASVDCEHLHATITTIYDKLEIAGFLAHQIEPLPKAEQTRRVKLLTVLREKIGNFLFCKYLPECANSTDFDNTINGTTTILDFPGSFSDTVTPSIPPDALYAISGLPHIVPRISEHHEPPLITLIANCDEGTRQLIKERACAPLRHPEGGLIENKTCGCEVLKRVTFPGGGWRGVDVEGGDRR
jgi:hypothetical protein